MPEIIRNPFDTSGFTVTTMTDGINVMPNNYGKVRASGLFTPEGIYTDDVTYEEINGVISLIKSKDRGGKPQQKSRGKSKRRNLYTAHVPLQHAIHAAELKRALQPGTNQQQTLSALMMKELTEMRASHAITDEFMQVGGLKGIILDSDGSTMYNLYTEFGITQKTVDFVLGTATTDIVAKCGEVVEHIEEKLLGDVMTSVHAYVSKAFMDKLISHANVEKFYLNHVAALLLAGSEDQPRKRFAFGGIVFEQYEGKAPDPSDGALRRFITAGEGHAFPEGTQQTFRVYYAPADYFDQLGQPGQEVHARQRMNAEGNRILIDTEANPLPLCRKPAVLVKLFSSN